MHKVSKSLSLLVKIVNQDNTTFIGGEPTWANACVGENGFPGYWDYAKGFSQAATILIDIALQGEGLEHSVDELVYPVCFNMRHSVELRLKGAISELILIEKCRGNNLVFDLDGSHDIGIIWSFFVKRSLMVDDRYKSIIKRLNKKISDIAEVDATGQTFRYPINKDSQKHLVDVAIISFVVLKQSFTILEATLDDLHSLNKYLCDEYGQGTFTKKMSRKNIFEMATFLPPRSTWSDESFGVTKNEIMERFNIGCRDLSKCIKHIEAHFELAPYIEMSVPLFGVVDTDIAEFLCHWFKLHDLPSDKAPIDLEPRERDFDAMFQLIAKNSEIRANVWNEVQLGLTPEKLAGLSALFYFAYDMYFSETYKYLFEIHLQEAHSVFADSESSVNSQYFHIFNKRNAVNNILKSLYFLKKSELADRLVAAHNLDKQFLWLDKARSWDLFRKPDYCGYAIQQSN